MPRHLISLLVLFTVLFLGCNYRKDKVLADSGVGVTEVSFEMMSETVLKPKCIECHGSRKPSGGLDLSSYNGLMDSGVVIAKRPKESKLYQSVQSARMPKGGEPLKEKEIGLIYYWIEQGANPPVKTPQIDPPITPPPPEEENKATYQFLRKNIFEKACFKCHSPPKIKAKVNLVSYESMMASTGDTMKPIVPGNPKESGIYDQVSTLLMPPGDPKCSTDEIKLIEKWILEGAKEK